jgi:23S rRNA (uracil1939-C5)-methyltransferase
MAPQRIVYVSCDPATLARDVKLLSEKDYALRSVEAVDMFPRTFHVETVCCLYHQKKDFISVPYKPKDDSYLKQQN